MWKKFGSSQKIPLGKLRPREVEFFSHFYNRYNPKPQDKPFRHSHWVRKPYEYLQRMPETGWLQTWVCTRITCGGGGRGQCENTDSRPYPQNFWSSRSGIRPEIFTSNMVQVMVTMWVQRRFENWFHWSNRVLCVLVYLCSEHIALAVMIYRCSLDSRGSAYTQGLQPKPLSTHRKPKLIHWQEGSTRTLMGWPSLSQPPFPSCGLG